MDDLSIQLYKSPKTIFTTQDLALIWEETHGNNLKAKISYYVKRGVLIRLTRGVFSRDNKYDPKELATSIYTPSYISFETVLREAGLIFQHYDSIFVAGPWPIKKNIGGVAMVFRRLKDEVLFNPKGIEQKGPYCIATVERAFLDMIYLFPGYYFDNLRSINWEVCTALANIYKNQQLIKRLHAYQK